VSVVLINGENTASATKVKDLIGNSKEGLDSYDLGVDMEIAG